MSKYLQRLRAQKRRLAAQESLSTAERYALRGLDVLLNGQTAPALTPEHVRRMKIMAMEVLRDL